MERDTATRRNLVLTTLGLLATLALIVWLGLPTPLAGTSAYNAGHRRIPVYYWHMWSAQWLPVMNHVVAEFNASQDKYEVIPLQVPGPPEGDQKFLLATAGGDPPDVVAQWTPAISAWAQAGTLQPLDSRMTPAERKYFMDDTFPVVHQNGWYKGRLYGLLVNFDVYACYYRPDQWRHAGLDPDRFPTNLDALVADGWKLNRTDESGRLTRLGFLPATFTDYVPSFSGKFYDDSSGEVLIDTPQNLAALDYIVQTHKRIGFDRVLRFSSGLGSQEGASWPFITGQQAVVLDGEWRVKQLAQYAPGMDYRVAFLPPPPGGKPLASFSATSYLTIPAGAKHADGAWEFIKFWSGLDDPARSAEFATRFGWLPNSPQMAAAPAYQAYLKQYPQYAVFVKLASSKNIVTLPPVPYSVFLQDKIAADDDLAERGALTSRQALGLLAKQVADEQRHRRELGYDQ